MKILLLLILFTCLIEIDTYCKYGNISDTSYRIKYESRRVSEGNNITWACIAYENYNNTNYNNYDYSLKISHIKYKTHLFDYYNYSKQYFGIMKHSNGTLRYYNKETGINVTRLQYDKIVEVNNLDIKCILDYDNKNSNNSNNTNINNNNRYKYPYYIFTITNMTSDNAGIYECTNINEIGEEYIMKSINVSYVDNKIRCSSDIDLEAVPYWPLDDNNLNITITCSFRYIDKESLKDDILISIHIDKIAEVIIPELNRNRDIDRYGNINTKLANNDTDWIKGYKMIFKATIPFSERLENAIIIARRIETYYSNITNNITIGNWESTPIKLKYTPKVKPPINVYIHAINQHIKCLDYARNDLTFKWTYKARNSNEIKTISGNNLNGLYFTFSNILNCYACYVSDNTTCSHEKTVRYVSN